MYILLSILLVTFQGGHRIQIGDVTSEEVFGEHGKVTFHTIGTFSIEPFDIKDRDAYVLLLSNANNTLTLHEYEKFALSDVNQLNFRWSYSFTIDKPEDDFNVYAVLVDRFSDKYQEELEADLVNMGSVEEVIARFRRTDRIDPLNFNIFWVRMN